MSAQRDLDRSLQLIDADGRATDYFASWLYDLGLAVRYTGSGSPEGVLTAPQYSVYVRTDGTAGSSMMYVKKSAELSGDRSQGWVLV